ncbi:MAG: DUF4476 domain-containing protein [Ignavibacteriales bacterium]|nr:MAG: DUF4476 domain-containing protein [Ignavibacteriales bacterium]
MKIKIILVVILCSVALTAQHKKRDKHNDDRVMSPKVKMTKIISALETLERDFLTKLSYRDYSRSKDLLIEIHDLLLSLPIEDEQYDPVEPMAMNEVDFQQLYNSVKNESYESDQLSIIEISARYNYFSVAQLVRLLELFSYSNGKVEMVRILYPNVIDKYNAHQLINALTYSSDKEKVKAIIDSNP